MKKVSFSAIAAVLAVVILLTDVVHVSNAVTCNSSELSSCLPAVTTPVDPSRTCCDKLKEQVPCLCGYLKDPKLKPYLTSPGAKKVASKCGVAIPTC